MPKLATDPPVSEPQRRAMFAAAAGHSTLGIPKKVGEEFVGNADDASVQAAGIIFLAPSGAVLWLKRSSVGDHPGEWCFPGGKIEGDETPEQAAVREAEEETSYVPEGERVPFDQSVSDEGVAYTDFLQRVDGEFQVVLDAEHDAWAWAPFDDPPRPVHPAIAALIDRVTKLNMKGAQDSLALDRQSVRTYDDDGHLHVAVTPISKANVCPYLGSEIPDGQALGLDPQRVYQLYRHPEELKKAAESFNGKPLLFRHAATTADAHQTDLTIGAVKNPEWKDPYLSAELDIWPAHAIHAIEDGSQRELSSGYRYRADMTPGRADDGTPYDGVMRDIVGNHVAIVAEGRAGSDVVIGDSAMAQKFANDAPSGALSEREQSVANRNPKERKETPAGVFLEPGARKYPVKIKRDGDWKYDRDLLLAAAREARMHGHADLAERADAIRKREFASTGANDRRIDTMPKTVLSRKAAVVQGALMAYLGPKLAADAKINLTPIVAKLTHDNYVKSKPAIIAEITKAVKGKLVGDAKLEDMHKLMDSLDREEPGEDEPEDKLDDHNAMDWEGKMSRVMDYLRSHGARDEDMEAIDAICKESAMDEEEEDKEDSNLPKKEGEDEPPKTDRTPKDGAAGGRDKGAKDRGARDKDMVTKSAMDAALKKTAEITEAATMRRLADIRTAERAVKPLVGEVAMGLDSAEAIYRAALKSKGIDIPKDLDPKALPAMVDMLLKAQPKQGVREMAVDAAPLTDRQAFEKANGIPAQRIRRIG